MWNLASKIDTVTQTPVEKSDLVRVVEQMVSANKVQSLCWLGSVAILSCTIAFCVWLIYKQKQ